MKTRYIGPKKSILVLSVGMLICWAAAGNAFEQWNAKTSARVNLRIKPSSNGVILSIVPKGHKVRIMEEDGPWYKVDVEGKVHGKGWVYAEYLEKITRNKEKTASALENMRSETAPGAPRKGTQTAEPPTAIRAETEKVEPLRTTLQGKTSIAVADEQSSARIELPETKIETGTLSMAEIPPAAEPAHIAPIQAPPEVPASNENARPLNASLPVKASMAGVKEQPSVRDKFGGPKNESNAVTQAENSRAVEPVQIPSAQSRYTGFKQDTLGISGKYFSGVIEPQTAAPYQKGLPDDKKEPGGVGPENPPPVREQAETDVHPGAASLETSAVPQERKRPINRRESMGPVRIALKLLSVGLSCLVILLLYMENKPATQRYDILRRIQHRIAPREHRQPDPVPPASSL